MPFWGVHDNVCSSNVKTNLQGTNNTGTARDNVNCVLNLSNSELKLSGNVNGKFDGARNNLSSNSCTNVSFRGNQNKLSFANETNLKFNGDDNNCTANSNTNLQISGSKNECKFERNTNAELKGSSSYVIAHNNTNFEVLGDGNDVNISNTVNHSLQNTNRNEIRVIPYGSTPSSFFGGMMKFGTQTGNVKGNGVRNPAKLIIQYVSRAIINNTNYTMGIFRFNMIHSEHQITATFDQSDFDKGTLTTSPGAAASLTELTLTASKDGTQQTLKFVAPRISHRESGGVTIVEITEINSKM